MLNKPSPSSVQSEAEFLERYDPSQFERPSVTVDLVLLTLDERRLRVLLLQRDAHPFQFRWALPGGFVQPTESLDQAAARVLRDKASLERVFFEQLYTFGDPARDPRTRVISVAYFALVEPTRLRDANIRTGGILASVSLSDAAGTDLTVSVRSASNEELPLAFDHGEIIRTAMVRLRGKLDYTPVGYQLLPPEFTLRALQGVHETILGRKLNKDAFRRRMLASGELQPTGTLEDNVGHRPAELYRFVGPSLSRTTRLGDEP